MCIHMENFRDLLFQRKTGFRGRQEKWVLQRSRECVKMEIIIREYKKEDAGAAAAI